MAFTITSLALPPLFVYERQTLLRPLQKFQVSAVGGGGSVVLLYASKYHDVCTVVNLSARYNLQRGMDSRLGKDFLERIKRDGFIDGTTKSERQGRITVVAKATGESSESSTSLSIVESVQNIWDKSEDRIAIIGLGFAAVVALWASANLVTAIDKLPLIPSVLEFVGILFSSWFVYRYLLFKPDREELGRTINKSISDILDQ